jgi:hypothetical protein
LLSRCIKIYCNTTKLLDILISDRPADFNTKEYKCDLNVMPNFIAYPFSWVNIGKAFEKDSNLEISRFIRSYTVHLNSYITRGNQSDVNSIVEYLMSFNCPIVYEMTQENKRKPLQLSWFQ